MTEITPETLKSELTYYEDLICSHLIYKNSPDKESVFTEKSCLMRLGLLTEVENHKLWEKARKRAEKTGRVN